MDPGTVTASKWTDFEDFLQILDNLCQILENVHVSVVGTLLKLRLWRHLSLRRTKMVASQALS